MTPTCVCEICAVPIIPDADGVLCVTCRRMQFAPSSRAEDFDFPCSATWRAYYECQGTPAPPPPDPLVSQLSGDHYHFHIPEPTMPVFHKRWTPTEDVAAAHGLQD